MFEAFGTEYYIDLETINEKCKTGNVTKDEASGVEISEISLFTYEVIKMCLERVLNDYQDPDDDLSAFKQSTTSISFGIAFNTLLKNNIIIENTNE